MATAGMAIIVSILSLAISILSLLVSLAALRRDRHRIIARASIYEVGPGKWGISLHAANAGKRPITLSFVSAQVGDRPPHSRSFSLEGPVEVAVGAFAATNIEPGDALYLWSSMEELKRSSFKLQDVLGKHYDVPLS